jgi:hypothetical protein
MIHQCFIKAAHLPLQNIDSLPMQSLRSFSSNRCGRFAQENLTSCFTEVLNRWS